MTYFYLCLAILAEVVGTNALKASNEFTEFWPSVLCIGAYGISVYWLSLVLRTMSVGVAYAIWAGLGIVLVAVGAAVWFGQRPDLPALIGMGLIIAGVIVIHLYSNTIVH